MFRPTKMSVLTCQVLDKHGLSFVSRIKLSRNDLKGNKNCFELAEGFKLLRVKLQ